MNNEAGRIILKDLKVIRVFNDHVTTGIPFESIAT